MALDGVFLRHITKEISDIALNTRVDKINQPNKDELIINLRGYGTSKKLFMSSRADSSRINFTEQTIENPPAPPMFCMLLRKKLLSAKLIEVRQVDLDRIINLKFSTYNIIGDPVNLTLIVEIMGKHSNIILVDDDMIVIDAIKRVGPETSSVRLVLPGVKYELPPPQNKMSILSSSAKDILNTIESKNTKTGKDLADCILSVVKGISPVVSREIAFLCEDRGENLLNLLKNFEKTTKDITGNPYIISDNTGKPIEFSFLNINQYENFASTKPVETFSMLLDDFFCTRDEINRMRSRSYELQKKLSNLQKRINKKMQLQSSELENSKNREYLRINADIISANIANIKKGDNLLKAENFYDNMKAIEINLDPALSPVQNAQMYYKKYKKANKAEKVLKEELKKAQLELDYIESVSDELSRAKSQNDINDITYELYSQGYVKKIKNQKKKKDTFSPIKITTSDGFEITVGRNNKENDRLTLRQAKKNDLWFHVKNIPGAHVILSAKTGNTSDISENAIYQAACIAAKNSKAKDSSKVAVDYTKVKNVRKPQGAKPGMVIYVNYKTIFADPLYGLKDNTVN